MSSLKLLISIHGHGFRADKYCKDVFHLLPGVGIENIREKCSSLIPGCDQVSSLWRSNSKKYELPKFFDEPKAWAGSWMDEMDVIFNYLDCYVSQLPDPKKYTEGEFSMMLNIVFLESLERPFGLGIISFLKRMILLR